MTRIFSGIQPTGELHLGNYLGAVRTWVREQNADALYCVVDLHALTIDVDPSVLRTKTVELAAGLLASGLDPEICTVFLQSHVAEHTRLSWLLECVVTDGELRRMTQFKDKSAKNDVVRGGLLTYPVLMAADVLLYDTDVVPVGDDQRQHMELCRVIAERFNNRFGETFVVPEAMVPKVAARVMDLQEPLRKMSKSDESPQGTVLMFDAPEAIERKFKRAVTDADGEVRYDPAGKPGISNLLEIYASLTGESTDSIASRYTAYGPLKSDLAQLVIAELEPIRVRRDELLADPAALRELLAKGAQRARATASATYERASTAMGLVAP